MFANSFKNSASLNRNFVDWCIGLTVSCFCGFWTSYYFGTDKFVIAQYCYLFKFGATMILPIFHMLKDRPRENEFEELTLAWVRYGTFVASFYATWLWDYGWTTMRELPVYYLGLVTIAVSGGILWLFFKPFPPLDRVYAKYRQVEAQMLYRRTLLLSMVWLKTRSIAEKCNKPVCRILNRLGIGMRKLPRALLENADRSYIHEKMVTIKEIRLLRLYPSPISRVIRCHMEHHSLDNAPQYEAISYNWGDSSRIQRILVDECWLKVTQNAYDALYNRSFYARTRHVWIDSVCIDQNDLTEKSKQVRLMTNIYERASRVIVFLGDRPDAHMTHDVLVELDRRRKWYGDSVLGQRLYREYIQQETSPRWQAFLNLLDQPWFERIWVLQEVAVAKTVHAIYGNRYIDWETLVELLRMFIGEQSAESMALLFSAGSNYNTRQVSNAPGFASMMTTVRELLREGKYPPFQVLLQATHAFKATNPRDKLFALIGISDPASCGPVKVDYRKDISSLYRETARYILIDRYDLSLLHSTGIGIPRNLMDLPSWVPDWSCSTINNLSQRQIYNTTKDRTSVIRGVSVHGVRDWNTVAISGKIVDTIERLSVVREWTINQDGVYEGELIAKARYSVYVEMRDLVEQYVPEVYETGQTREEALWRTMIGDVGLENVRPASSGYGDYYRVWHRMQRDLENFVSCCKRDVLPPGYNTQQELVDASLHFTRYNTVFGQFTWNRRFCVTKNGYIGMVPQGTQPGDLVCVLFGADTPFIIRDGTQQSFVHRSYKLVGDCYIHGMMDGEGLESQVPEGPIILL